MEIDYSEVFGVEPETGVEEQEAAAPAEQGVEEREAAEPAVEEHEEETDVGEPAQEKTEEDARYAAARRKAEADRDAEIERVRREAREATSRAVDDAIRSSGMVDPYLGKPITSKAELDAYLTRHQEEQAEAMQKKAGLTREQYQAFVNSLPEVRQARQAQAQAEDQAKQIREQTARARIEEQIREISALDPSVKSLGDLTKLESYPRLREMVQRGNTLVDAYKLANYDALTQRAAEASRKAAVRAAAGKEHLSTTVQRGTGAVTVPEDVKAEYKAFNPDATDEEIQKHYQKYVKK